MVALDLGFAGRASDPIEANDPRTDGGSLPAVGSVGSRGFGSGFVRQLFVIQWEVDGGVFIVPWGNGLGRLGLNLLIRCVAGGVDGYGVDGWVLVFASASLSEVASESGVNPSAVVGVGVGGFARWESGLVAASAALVGVVHVAVRTVTNVSFATWAAVAGIVRVADVASLWGVEFGSFRRLARCGGWFWVGGIGGRYVRSGSVNWVGVWGVMVSAVGLWASRLWETFVVFIVVRVWGWPRVAWPV